MRKVNTSETKEAAMCGWSVELIERTRAALCEYAFVPVAEVLHFKHSDCRFGAIAVSDILAGRLVMVDKSTLQEIPYADPDALIADGWVLD
jgi:hypothetical protein